MRKTVQAILSAAIVLIAAQLWTSAASALDLKIGDVEVASGQTAIVSIRASNTAGLGALQMRVGFDGNVVEVIEVTAGPILSNALVEFKANANNCSIALASPNAITTDGDLLLIKIRRKPGSTAGSILLPEAVRAWTSEGGQPLQVSLTPGHVLPIAGAPEAAGTWYWLISAVAGAFGIAIGFVAAQMIFRYRRGAAVSFAAVTPAAQDHPKFCSTCGTALRPEANFCANCGKRLH